MWFHLQLLQRCKQYDWQFQKSGISQILWRRLAYCCCGSWGTCIIFVPSLNWTLNVLPAEGFTGETSSDWLSFEESLDLLLHKKQAINRRKEANSKTRTRSIISPWMAKFRSPEKRSSSFWGLLLGASESDSWAPALLLAMKTKGLATSQGNELQVAAAGSWVNNGWLCTIFINVVSSCGVSFISYKVNAFSLGKHRRELIDLMLENDTRWMAGWLFVGDVRDVRGKNTGILRGCCQENKEEQAESTMVTIYQGIQRSSQHLWSLLLNFSPIDKHLLARFLLRGIYMIHSFNIYIIII